MQYRFVSMCRLAYYFKIIFVFSLMPHPVFFYCPVILIQSQLLNQSLKLRTKYMTFYSLGYTKSILWGVSITALLSREQRSFLGIWPKVEGGGNRDKGLVSRWDQISFHFPFCIPPCNMPHRYLNQEEDFRKRTGSTG